MKTPFFSHIRHLFFALILCTLSLHADHIIIVVHGTWANAATWASPGGDFFESVEKTKLSEDTHVIPFTWSGQNKRIQRERAAKNLVKIMQSYPPDTQFTIMAHSHGVNVSLLASQYLAKEQADKQRTINTLYAMGAPIKESFYYPDMNIIQHLYNMFSFGDIVQPVFNKWSRVFNPHARIANLSVTLNGQEPDHSQLHDPLIGANLTTLDQMLRTHYPDTVFSEPGALHFCADTQPIYIQETYVDRTKRLETDQVHVKRRWAQFVAEKAKRAIMPRRAGAQDGAQAQASSPQTYGSWMRSIARAATNIVRRSPAGEEEEKEQALEDQQDSEDSDEQENANNVNTY